ncbi:MAG TPA: hypothetical protein DCM73_06925 [Clostridiales bacterium]|nr:hypothetical protein [Clostridiales bacterium]
MEKAISKEALKYFYEYSWPGNVRELQNLIERLVVTTMDDTITKANLPAHLKNNIYEDKFDLDNNIPKLSDVLGRVEKDLIFKAYEKFGNVRSAAKELGIDPSTFVRKRKKYM